MALKKLPIGISDFKRLIEEDYYFVDKSMLIKELLAKGAIATLLPRPRRFGKTLNLSMLRYFFEKSSVSNRHLFSGLKIEQCPECMAYQGNYPVIFLTLKDAKHSTWELCYALLKQVIAEEFRRHHYLLKSNLLDEQQRKTFLLITGGMAEEIEYLSALKTLSTYLHAFYGKRVIILIDEYDAGIHQGFVNNYYHEITTFMRSFLSAGLKDNNALEYSVLTGILRVGKESIFSGLNNLVVRTWLNEEFSTQFGLLEEEVSQLLKDFNMSSKISTICQWYDGYQSGAHHLYNPWSIINLIGNNGVLQPYWVNTSDNALIKTLLINSSTTFKEDFEHIEQKKKITKIINENIILPDIHLDDTALWSFLVMSGYLTFENYRPNPQKEGQFLAELTTPNTEVAYLYTSQIQSWFSSKTGSMKLYQTMLQNLTSGDTQEFCKLFEIFTEETISVFDISGTQPEKFYHALVLGMLASLRETHEIKSNRESGWGRYDLMVIPREKGLPGIIMEFKTAHKESLKKAAQRALQQIDEKLYDRELKNRGITDIIKLGIAFEGKQSLVLIG